MPSYKNLVFGYLLLFVFGFPPDLLPTQPPFLPLDSVASCLSHWRRGFVPWRSPRRIRHISADSVCSGTTMRYSISCALAMWR
ncbi:hypothetical protein B0T21DRAFT_62785 [Apiosordaria backusii]|uniref:Secreted protein n=1 Tax=Apiosordaria backusii TaxID=314023 RepID=A0AA40DU62_9PEZI|nr:hypothetical protein B0T21DRAFT_62785 [Apiosordaria backusii]